MKSSVWVLFTEWRIGICQGSFTVSTRPFPSVVTTFRIGPRSSTLIGSQGKRLGEISQRKSLTISEVVLHSLCEATLGLQKEVPPPLIPLSLPKENRKSRWQSQKSCYTPIWNASNVNQESWAGNVVCETIMPLSKNSKHGLLIGAFMFVLVTSLPKRLGVTIQLFKEASFHPIWNGLNSWKNRWQSPKSWYTLFVSENNNEQQKQNEKQHRQN